MINDFYRKFVNLVAKQVRSPRFDRPTRLTRMLTFFTKASVEELVGDLCWAPRPVGECYGRSSKGLLPNQN